MDVMTQERALPGEGVDEGGGGRPRVSGRRLRELLADDSWLDELIDRADDGGVTLTGEGGFLPELIKAVLERGLAAELTGHLGYEPGDPGGRGSGNSRKRHHPQDGGDRGGGRCRWTCRGTASPVPGTRPS